VLREIGAVQFYLAA